MLFDFFVRLSWTDYPTASTIEPILIEPKEGFSLTIVESEQLAGFEALEFDPPPPGLAFTGASFIPEIQAILVLYSGEKGLLLVTQTPAGDTSDVYNIDPGALVEQAQVRGRQAEYVRGGWVTQLEIPQPDLTAGLPGEGKGPT